MKEEVIQPDIPNSPEVQSVSVGSTPHARKKKAREIQGLKVPKRQSLKKVMTDHLAKLSSGLR